MNEYLTTEDLADMLRTSPSTVRFWHHNGTGPRSFKVGRRRLYERADVDTWITEARESGGAA